MKNKPDFLRALSRSAANDVTGEYYPSKHLLGQIYRRVSSIKYDIPDTVGNDFFNLRERLDSIWKVAPTDDFAWTKDLDETGGDAHRVMAEVYGIHVDYCKEQGVPGFAELDLFLRRPEDDFPNSIIRALGIRLWMLFSRYQIIRVPDIDAVPLLVQLSEKHERGKTERLYKQYLYMVW